MHRIVFALMALIFMASFSHSLTAVGKTFVANERSNQTETATATMDEIMAVASDMSGPCCDRADSPHDLMHCGAHCGAPSADFGLAFPGAGKDLAQIVSDCACSAISGSVFRPPIA